MFLFSHCISHLMYVLYWNTRFNKYQIFRNRYRDFFSDTKFSETDTETSFPIPNFPKPKPRLFFRYQIFRNRYRDFFSDTKFSETETDTLKKLAKVSKPKPRLLFRYQIF